MNKYEGIIILKGDLTEKDLEQEYSKIEETAKKQECAIEKSEKWSKRRLAFEIDKYREGFFYYMLFDAKPEAIKTLNEIYRLNGNILRAQIIRKK